MAGFSAQLDPSLTGPQPIAGDEPGEFSKGLRSGALGMGSQLQSFAGGTARALGFDQFAAGRDAAARQLQEEATAAGPRVGSYRDVSSLRDAVDYGLGVAGQAVPSVAAGVGAGAAVGLTGGGAIPALLAGAATQFPMEAGDVFQRQQLDPASAGRGAGENLLRAYGGGAASALGQAIVPAGLGGKLVGATVKGAEKSALKEGIKTAETGVSKGTLRQAFTNTGAAALKDAAIEGGSEGGGELVKQFATNENAPVDWQAVGENAVAGAVVGAPMGGLGHAAEGFHENKAGLVQGTKDLATGAYQKGKEGLAGAASKVYSAPGEATGSVLDTANNKDLSGLADNAMALGKQGYEALVKKGTDMVDAFKKAGTPKDTTEDSVAGASPIAGLSPQERDEVADTNTPRERANELIKKAGTTIAETGQKAATALANRVGLSPETRQRAAEVASNAGDTAGAAWATAQRLALKAKDATIGKLAKIGETYKANKEGVKDFATELNEASDKAYEDAVLNGGSHEDGIKAAAAAMDPILNRVAAEYDAAQQAEADKQPLGKKRATLGLKKSEAKDLQGLRDVIQNDLLPHMPDSMRGDDVPSLVAQKLLVAKVQQFMATASKPAGKNFLNLQKDADAIRQVMTQGNPDADHDAIDNALVKLYMHTTFEDQKSVERFLGVLKGGREYSESRASLESTVAGALPDELKGNAAEYADTLKRWARGEFDANVPGQDGKDFNSFQREIVERQMRKDLGAKYDAVLNAAELAVEKESLKRVQGDRPGPDSDGDPESGVVVDNEVDTNPHNQPVADSVETVANKYYVDPATGKKEWAPMRAPYTDSKGRKNSTQKLLEAQRAKHPNAEVKWVSEKAADTGESTGMGLIHITKGPDEGNITGQQWRNARLQTEKQSASQKAGKGSSRVDVPLGKDADRDGLGLNEDADTLILDAVKMSRAGADADRASHASSGGTDAQRMARGFFSAYAQIVEQFGVKPKMTLDTVIGKLAGKDFTLRDAAELDLRTAGDKASDAERAKANATFDKNKQMFEDKINDLRAKYEAAQTQGERVALSKQGRESVERYEAFKKAHEDQMAERVGIELMRTDPDEQTTNAIADELLNGKGRYEIPEDGNIHELEATKGENKLAVQGERSELRQKASAKKWMLEAMQLQEKGGIAERLGDKLEALSRIVNTMGKADRMALDNALDPKPVAKGDPAIQRTVGSVGEVVNSLIKKYSEQLAAPKGEGVQLSEGSSGNKTAPGESVRPKPKASDYTGQPSLAFEGESDTNVPAKASRGSAFDEGRGAPHIGAKDIQGPTNLNGTARRAAVAAPEAKQPSAAEHAAQVKALEAKHDALLREYEDALGQHKRDLYAQIGEVETQLEQLDKEDPNRPKAVAAKKAALDQAASSSDPALIKELRTTNDVGALGRTAEYLAERHPDTKAAEVAGEHYDQLAQDPDNAYAQTKKSESVQRGQGMGPAKPGNTFADALQYLHKVLGNSIYVDFSKVLGHSGDWNPTKNLLRVSAASLNPKSVAYHESLHAFFTQLYRAGAQRVAGVLLKASQSQHVQDQLNAYFKNEPRVLRAMKADPEESAAYMYQLWAQGDLKLNPQATTLFGKIAEFFRSALGIWSNDQRALHIMEHFNSGEYAKNVGKPNTVALLKPGTNPAIEATKAMFSPATDMGEKVFAAGSSRLRDTGVPAMQKIADLVKKRLVDKGGDVGFLSAAREERAWRMNQLADDLGHLTQAEQSDVLHALQTGTTASTVEGKAAQAVIGQYMGDMLKYIDPQGMWSGGLGPKYFPRVWDPDTISKNQTGFIAMVEKYRAAGMYKGDPHELMRRLTTNDGNNFAVDTRQPGFQSGKERELGFISGADAEPFLNKNLYETLNNYTTQATRRVEFGKRFGAQGEHLTALMEQARDEGATDEQLKTAETYMKGVTGTLGDGINPTARRMMGNLTVYQNIRLLPLAMFSSVVDPLGIMVRGGTVGDAYKAFTRIAKDIPRIFKESGVRDWQEELAQTLGVIDNATLMHAVGAMYTQGMVGNTARKINDAFFKYNLMETVNRATRIQATEGALKFMDRHANQPNQHSARYLQELGLKASDIQRDPATGRLKVTEADGLTPEHADRMRSAVNQWVDGAVLRPDNADRPIWFNDPHFMLLSHLKSFTYSFHHTIIDRVIHEAKHGNYQPMAVMASYVPTMIAADYMKGLIQGGGDQPAWKKDWGPADYLWSGVQRGGLLGVGQFGADIGESLRRGNSGLGALAGPTFDQLGDAVDVAGGRERFGKFVLDSMPANALYGAYLKQGPVARDPVFAE